MHTEANWPTSRTNAENREGNPVDAKVEIRWKSDKTPTNGGKRKIGDGREVGEMRE